MFKSLKFFVNQTVDINEILKDLVAFGYKRVKSVYKEGEFAQRSGIFDVSPTNFDCPIRIELDDDKIHSIKSINLATNKAIWQHKIVIILPKKTPSRMPFSSNTPLNQFVDINKGDYIVHNNYGIGRFLGITQMKGTSKTREHLVIEYLGGPEFDTF